MEESSVEEQVEKTFQAERSYFVKPFETELKVHLEPGLMKGPNASMPLIDDLPKRIPMHAWRNIPIPLQEALIEIMNVFKELKTYLFQNYNNMVNTQRVVNMN